MNYFDYMLFEMSPDNALAGEIRALRKRYGFHSPKTSEPNTTPLEEINLAEENFELKLRLSLLVRLLISKNVITAEEYATLITQSRPR